MFNFLRKNREKKVMNKAMSKECEHDWEMIDPYFSQEEDDTAQSICNSLIYLTKEEGFPRHDKICLRCEEIDRRYSHFVKDYLIKKKEGMEIHKERLEKARQMVEQIEGRKDTNETTSNSNSSN